MQTWVLFPAVSGTIVRAPAAGAAILFLLFPAVSLAQNASSTLRPWIADLSSADGHIAGAAQDALVARGPSVVGQVLEALPDMKGNARVRALVVVGRVGDPRGADSLVEMLTGPYAPDRRKAVMEGLRQIGDNRAADAAARLLNHADPWVQALAADVLAAHGTARHLGALERLARTSSGEIELESGKAKLADIALGYAVDLAKRPGVLSGTFEEAVALRCGVCQGAFLKPRTQWPLTRDLGQRAAAAGDFEAKLHCVWCGNPIKASWKYDFGKMPSITDEAVAGGRLIGILAEDDRRRLVEVVRAALQKHSPDALPRNLGGSLGPLRESLKGLPAHSDPREFAARALEDGGDAARALAIYVILQKGAAKEARLGYRFREAECRRVLGQEDQALAIYEEIAKADPRRPGPPKETAPVGDAPNLDFHFRGECPRCEGPEGWTGKTKEEMGLLYLEMLCTDCQSRGWEYKGRWAAEFKRPNPPTFTPGRQK